MTCLHVIICLSLVFYSLIEGRAIGRNFPDHDLHHGYDVIGDSSSHIGVNVHRGLNGRQQGNAGILYFPSDGEHHHGKRGRYEGRRGRYYQQQPEFQSHLRDQLRSYLAGTRGRYHHTIGNTFNGYSRHHRGPI